MKTRDRQRLRQTSYDVRQGKIWDETTRDLPAKLRRIVDDKVLDHIRFSPMESELLQLELKGLRSYRLKTGHRIIFAICEECRRLGFNKVNNCSDCDELSDNTIMLFAFGHHEIYDWLSRKREKMLGRRGR